MTTSSEDVLLSVSHVRYKKGDGTLYVMNQRLAWMLEHRDTVAVSHKYADIKTQKISPVGKPKVQLQVVLHDGVCSTFQFVNPAGADAQVKDRDQVKFLLQDLLPKFKRQIDGELEMKSRLLSLHPILKHLYEDLVISKVINSEEYWNTPTLKQYTESNNVKQDVGVSGAFLADIQPQTDGCNGLKYNLTQDIIEAIFKTYPAVRKKHIDYVPKKMTEAEFWTKFFQSHYFHRDRIASSSSKDLFGECAKMDDQAIASAMKHTPLDLTVDLPHFNEPIPLLPSEDEPSTSTDKDKGESTSIHRNMIKRFNQHSIMVKPQTYRRDQLGGGGGDQLLPRSLYRRVQTAACKCGVHTSIQAPRQQLIATATATAKLIAAVLKASQQKPSTSESSNNNSKVTNNNTKLENGIKEHNGLADKRPAEPITNVNGLLPEKKRRLFEKVHYEDLSDSVKCDDIQELKLSKIERYLLGPSSQIGSSSSSKPTNPPPLSAVASICQAWCSGQGGRGGAGGALGGGAAVAALGELSPGGALMAHHTANTMAQLIPPDVKAELHRLYLCAGELLRELWRCFPQPGAPPSAETEPQHYYEALHRFRNLKLRPFEEKMLRDLTPLASSLTKHLNQMIDVACAKYAVWQQRQAKLR